MLGGAQYYKKMFILLLIFNHLIFCYLFVILLNMYVQHNSVTQSTVHYLLASIYGYPVSLGVEHYDWLWTSFFWAFGIFFLQIFYKKFFFLWRGWCIFYHDSLLGRGMCRVWVSCLIQDSGECIRLIYLFWNICQFKKIYL